ncbi:MAG: methyltransferase, TIGR04325 family [Candidatus Edwardsbacteria bacterium]|nr:methyltransferase, TIGR04325 family [Candidatus Edwardsbacteria bacterium]
MSTQQLTNLLCLGSRFTWHGIYPRYRDVPCYGRTLEQGHYVRRVLTRTRALQRMADTGARLDDEEGQFVLLPLLASTLVDAPVVRVLDFGGGLGISYLYLKQYLPPARIDYRVVETGRMCQLGRELFGQAGDITFGERIEPGTGPVDIVHVSSALQYIEDYPVLLDQLCCVSAGYILLNKFSTGDFPTYATAQRIGRGYAVPYWFINYREAVDRVRIHGYRLIYASRSGQEYDQRNFPPQYRMGRTWNLLFRRDQQQRREG